MAEKVVIGNAELWHGDCREVLPLLPKCDLILTDPPYGIGASSGVGKYGVMKWGGDADKKWDEDTPPQWLMLLMLEKADNLIVFGGNYFSLPPSPNPATGFSASLSAPGLAPTPSTSPSLTPLRSARDELQPLKNTSSADQKLITLLMSVIVES